MLSWLKYQIGCLLGYEQELDAIKKQMLFYIGRIPMKGTPADIESCIRCSMDASVPVGTGYHLVRLDDKTWFIRVGK
jgi:hypothetical protein